MKQSPLIRKEYSLGNILAVLFSKIFQNPQPGDKKLYIPKWGKGEENLSLFKTSIPKEVPPLDKESRKSILKAAAFNQLKGMGGGGFPLEEKLRQWQNAPMTKKILINAVECDPGLHHDQWLLSQYPQALTNMAMCLQEVFQTEQPVLAVKSLVDSKSLTPLRIHQVEPAYPAGEEKRLIESIWCVSSGDYTYPTEIGILVMNLQSLFRLYLSLCYPQYLERRFLTLVDLDQQSAKVLECSQDSTIEEIRQATFSKHSKVFLGGGLMQGRPAQGDERLESSINLIAIGNCPTYDQRECKKCLQCTRHCPAQLEVHRIYAEGVKAYTLNDPPASLDKNLCLHCGSCSYLCPSGIDLAYEIIHQ